MYRRSGRGRLLLLAFLSLSIFIITLDFRQGRGGVFDAAREFAGAVVAPIQRGFSAIAEPIEDFFSSLGELNDARERVEELEARLKQLERQREQAQAVLDENVRLRAAAELDEPWFDMDKVTAEVIGQDPSNYKWAVKINRGRAAGIRRDMAVVDPDGLVGKVIAVDRNYATVLLLVDPQAGAGARIEGGRDRGVVTGNGAEAELSLGFIGTNAEVDVGDEVITSGYDDGIFPPGIPIGTVSAVGNEGGGIEKDVRVDPASRFSDLDIVMVLLETGPRLRPPPANGLASE